MLTLASIVVYVWLYLNRKKLNAKWWEILIVTIIHVIFGVFMVKLFAIVEVGFDTSKAGNMSLYGGIFFMPIFYLVYKLIKRLPFKVIFDIFTVSLIATLFFARINCLHAGCCIGKVINGSYRYPTREIELIFYVILLMFITPWIYKGKSDGRAYPVYMISYGIFRFVIEFFRESPITEETFHISHYWSILSFVIGTSLLIYLILKARRSKTNGNE